MAGGFSLWLRGVAVAFACGLLACAGAGLRREAPAAAVGPLLWRADAPGGAGAFYLLGSVHIGDRRMQELPAVIQAAYDGSSELVVEVDISRLTSSDMEDLIGRYAFLPPETTLAGVVSEATWLDVDAYAASRGYALATLERFKPWFLAFTIVQFELGRAGFDEALGVDRVFIDAAVGEKPIVALETVASQLEMLDSMSPDAQELMLRDTLGRVDDLASDTEQLIDAWERGDEARLEALVFQPLENSPELSSFYENVFFARNRAMAARLVGLAGDGEMRFVVLGAGHMVGERGIPALLAGRGWRVARVGQAARE